MFFLKKSFWPYSDFHCIGFSADTRKSGPFMALSVVLVAKYDPVVPEMDMPLHNGSDKMHRQSSQ